MLYIPRIGCSRTENNEGTTSSEFGTAVTASSTPHVKNTTWTELIASTAYDAWGIFIAVFNVAYATTAVSFLLDIGIGAASSEVVIVPDLVCGSCGVSNQAESGINMWFFPIFIKAGSRIAGTGQALIASDTAHVQIHLLQYPIPGMWYGRRVTAYGITSAYSYGTLITPDQNAYCTPVALSASTSRPIKYLQAGIDMGGDSTGLTARGLMEILVNDVVLVNALPYTESASRENSHNAMINMMLSHMYFNIPAGVSLKVAAMRDIAGEARSFALYGVE
jgi:hypothetical protein